MLFWVAKSKGSFTALFNSRISTKSLPKIFEDFKLGWLTTILAISVIFYAQSLA